MSGSLIMENQTLVFTEDRKMCNKILANYHTHTVFCDGKNTPEEVVLAALEKGFCALGFSGHVTTPYDLTYCMKDTEGYIQEIVRLKEKYKDKIQIYLGTEEDIYSLIDRKRYDYIIGSMHYIHKDGKFYSIDSGTEDINKCYEIFDNDVLKFAEAYFCEFVDYINKRKPDIVGHFDLITKYDEQNEPIFLNNEEYFKIAEKYLKIAAGVDTVFEVNTGAVAKGIRKTPYLGERLLRVLKKADAKIIISSDSHKAETLDFGFEDVKYMLKDLGFDGTYVLYNGKFQKRAL